MLSVCHLQSLLYFCMQNKHLMSYNYDKDISNREG